LNDRLRLHPSDRRPLRDVLPDVLGQHFVDQRLLANPTPTRFLPEFVEHTGSTRMAISWRVRSPIGGRPTRRMARN
jgi:hypothetical protein